MSLQRILPSSKNSEAKSVASKGTIQMPIMRIFIVFALISFTQIFCAPSEQQQFEFFAEEIRQWDEIRPLELVWNVQEIIELLQGEHTLSMHRSDKMWLAIDITSHFLRKDDPAELFDCITTIRDPTKLCPLRAFVSAMLSRLSADFVTIRGSQKWHSDVAHALMHLDTEFSDVALTKRDINQQNKYCAKWHGSEEFKRLANLIHIDWEKDGDTIPEFNIEDMNRSNIMRNENDLAEYMPRSWQEMSKYWHAKVILNKKLREIQSLHFVKELYAFALKLSWLLEFARPRGQIKGRLNSLADQKWPSRMEFHEKFSNLVSQFSEHLHNEMPQIALEKHLLRSTDICKAWLYWYYEQQKGTTTETLPLDDADIEFQCKNSRKV
uniref:Uncharacterized protein n=1 Tax=Globodera rostochiensis TaxID=31243 RepID=A0A914GZS5_GLORO